RRATTSIYWEPSGSCCRLDDQHSAEQRRNKAVFGMGRIKRRRFLYAEKGIDYFCRWDDLFPEFLFRRAIVGRHVDHRQGYFCGTAVSLAAVESSMGIGALAGAIMLAAIKLKR